MSDATIANLALTNNAFVVSRDNTCDQPEADLHATATSGSNASTPVARAMQETRTICAVPVGRAACTLTVSGEVW